MSIPSHNNCFIHGKNIIIVLCRTSNYDDANDNVNDKYIDDDGSDDDDHNDDNDGYDDDINDDDYYYYDDDVNLILRTIYI